MTMIQCCTAVTTVLHDLDCRRTRSNPPLIMRSSIASHVRHSLVLLLFTLSLLHLGTRAINAADTFGNGRNISDGETLVSAGGSFTMGFFSLGAPARRYLGTWFSVSEDAVYWVANRDRPLNGTSGVLVLGNAGRLLLLDGGSQVAWSTYSTGAASAVAQLLESGNLVVRERTGSGAVLWQSFDHPSNTLLPGMKTGKNLWTGAEWYITSWRSANDPSPGPYRRGTETAGQPENTVWRGDVKTYRTGPWNGLYFNGVPEMASYADMFTYQVTASPGEVTYGYHAKPRAPPSRVVVTDAGTIQRLVWYPSSRAWKTFYSAPRDACDAYARCGAFGLCDVNAASTSFCSCVEGFRPASPSAWYMRDTSSGCRRDVPLDCGAGGDGSTSSTTDGFAVVRGVKLPDTHNVSVDASIELEECRERCLANCSCVAYAAADIRGGGGAGRGCIIWSDAIVDIRYMDKGQDLYLRLAKSELDEAQYLPFPTALVSGASIASLVVVLFVLSFVTIVIRRRRHGPRISGNGQRVAEGADADSRPNPGSTVRSVPALDLATIEEATRNFSERNIIGEGGFGNVYEGQLPDGTKVAVKRLKQSRLTERSKEDFSREVELMSGLTHVNLAKLLYYCQEREEWILVYEYMEKKSLDLYIFAEDVGLRPSLNWVQRLEIIRGIATGVEYLHGAQVIHRDLKPGNILLDDTWKPKVSDFGTAKLFFDDQTDPTLVLTPGYIAPEYASQQFLTLKCDVYSFGVILLETVRGKRVTTGQTFLADVWESWNQGEIEALLDSQVTKPEPELSSELARFVQIGLLCVQLLPEDRPTMPQVVVMLTDSSSRLARPKKPVLNAATGYLQKLNCSFANFLCSN